MNDALESMLARYRPESFADYENALKEIVQELALLGLWRSKFYEHASFYGGTALRIFHRLPRFSEDMDFSLLSPDTDFDLVPHLAAIQTELAAFGFEFEVERKMKAKPTAIESDFIKGETQVNLLTIGTPDSIRSKLPKLQRVKIKLEVDTDPPPLAVHDVETLLVPLPFQVRLFTPPCLFAGKLHAVLCRAWKGRVKGRDFYDLIWYLGREIPVHLAHLQARMEQTGHWVAGDPLTLDALRGRLLERFAQIDFEAAKADVRPLLRDAEELVLWSREFFDGLVPRLAATE